MKIILSVIVCIFSCCPSFAQKGKGYFLVDSVNYDLLSAADKEVLDSLLPAYQVAKHDTTRLAILVSMVENISNEGLWPRYNDLLFNNAKTLLNDSASFTPKVLRSLKKSYGMALQNKGYFEENFKNNNSAALQYYYECKKIQEEIKDYKNLGITLNNIGISFNHIGNVVKSLEYYMQSLKIQETNNDIAGISGTLNNIAYVYLEYGDTTKAIEYLNKTIKLREETGGGRGLAIALINIASIYRSQRLFEKAELHISRSFKIWEELGDKQGLAHCFQYLGNAFQEKAEKLKREGKTVPDSLFQKALDYMKKALQLSEQIGDKRIESSTLNRIGYHYLFDKNYDQALLYGQKSLTISKDIGHPDNIHDASLLLYSIYKKKEKWNEALAMYELNIQMRDSLSNEETKKSVFKQRTKYEFEKQQALNDLENQKVLALAEEEKKRQQVISFSIGIGLIMMLLFVVFIFNRLQITRKQKLVIEEQKGIVDEKNKHITYSINYAKRIQDAILPSKEELKKCFSDHFVFFQPREIVSGDFYWVSRQGNKTILAAADCTGHGVPGAFMSMIGNTLLNEIVNAKKILQPAEILNHLNEGIVQALHQESRLQDDGMDISVCLFDKDNNVLTFAGANHSLYVVDGGILKKTDGDYLSIGSMFRKQETSFSQKEIPLSQNSVVFFSTDGFADQPGGEKGNKFMTKRFQELLRSLAQLPIQEQKNKIKQTFEEWKNTKQQIDDVLVMGIKI